MSYQEKINEKEKTLEQIRKQVDEQTNILLRLIVEMRSQQFYDPAEVFNKLAEVNVLIFQYNVTFLQIDSMKTYDSIHER